MKLESLQELYVGELQDLYNAEHQLLLALPKLSKAASAPQLRQALERYLREKRRHVKRLQRILDGLDTSPKSKRCRAMEGLLEEGKDVINDDGASTVRDAALVAAAQRVWHYEIAGYGCVSTYARLLGEEDAAELLQETLNEVQATDELVTQLAVSSINIEAKATMTGSQKA